MAAISESRGSREKAGQKTGFEFFSKKQKKRLENQKNIEYYTFWFAAS